MTSCLPFENTLHRMGEKLAFPAFVASTTVFLLIFFRAKKYASIEASIHNLKWDDFVSVAMFQLRRLHSSVPIKLNWRWKVFTISCHISVRSMLTTRTLGARWTKQAILDFENHSHQHWVVFLCRRIIECSHIERPACGHWNWFIILLWFLWHSAANNDDVAWEWFAIKTLEQHQFQSPIAPTDSQKTESMAGKYFRICHLQQANGKLKPIRRTQIATNYYLFTMFAHLFLTQK